MLYNLCGNKLMNLIKKLFSPVDLTHGKPITRLIRFAIPILLSTLLSNAFSLINALILKTTVGGISVTATNSTSSISAILFNFAYGCTSGFAVIMANKKGKKDEDAQNKTLYTCFALVIIIGLIITIVGLCSYKALMSFLNIPEMYIEKASNYFQIILIGFLITLMSNLMSNFVTALGNSSLSLLVSLAGTSVNILFGFLFTGVIKLDTRGVAIATLLANCTTFSLNFLYLMKNHPYLRFRKGISKVEKNYVIDCLKMGLPLGFQWSILFIGSFFQQKVVNGFGRELVIDPATGTEKEIGYATMANTCYGSFENYLTIPLSVMSSALLHYVGQNYGARDKDRIRQGIRSAILIDFITYSIILTIGLSCAKYVPYIFLTKNDINERVIYYCSTYLFVLTPFLICQGLLQLSRSVLQGIKKPIIPLISGIGELVARILVCEFIPGLINPSNPTSDASYVGVCFSTPSAWVVSVLIMGGMVIYFVVIKKLDVVDKAIALDKKETNENK